MDTGYIERRDKERHHNPQRIIETAVKGYTYVRRVRHEMTVSKKEDQVEEEGKLAVAETEDWTDRR